MRVLITGGAGFLGAALANRLVQDGHHVRVLDDLSAGDPAQLLEGVLFTRGDVGDVPRLWTLLQSVDCVFHLAARVSVPESILYPREYNHVNVGGTVALLEAVRHVGVQRVILASSAAVYGNQTTQPVHERLTPVPQAPYAVTKLAAEYYLFSLGALYGFETVALRIFNAYGPGQPLPPSHAPVVPQFLRQILGGGSVMVHGNGLQSRDFVFVDDVVAAMVAAAQAPAKDVNQQIINLGSGRETTINSLIKLISQVTKRPVDIIYNDEANSGVSRLVADLSKARSLLGYQPQVSLEEGLQRLIQEDIRFMPGSLTVSLQ